MEFPEDAGTGSQKKLFEIHRPSITDPIQCYTKALLRKERIVRKHSSKFLWGSSNSHEDGLRGAPGKVQIKHMWSFFSYFISFLNCYPIRPYYWKNGLSQIHRMNKHPPLHSVSEGSLARRRHSQKQHVKSACGTTRETKIERGRHFRTRILGKLTHQ